MSLDSIEYIFFLPVAFALYWTVPARKNTLRNALLVVLNYAFYAFADVRFCGLLALVSLLTYASGRAMHTLWGGRRAKAIAITNVAVCLGILFVFKYYGFFASQIAPLIGADGSVGSTTVSLVVPVGVSFYVFMAISYTVDRYKKVIKDCPSLTDFLAYISFFPHLLAGPIDRGRDMIPQLQRQRTFRYGMAVDGMRQMLGGLFKKVVVADTVAIIVNNVWNGYSQASTLMLVMAAVLYSVQIYADFSGYSDIAVGTGKLFGLQMRRNFAYPYFARNVSEFWRRWHMSLTSWFTEYLYIPLGGNRKGKARTVVNTLIVFTLCGFWHGADWTYMVWGFLSGVLFVPLILSPRMKKRWQGQPSKLDVANIVAMFVTFTAVTACWIVFRAPGMEDAAGYVCSMFTNLQLPFDISAYSSDAAVRTLSFLMLATMIVVEWRGRNCEYPLVLLQGKNVIVRRAVYVVIVLLVMLCVTSSDNFIYQNF